jgi:hypothetical protein
VAVNERPAEPGQAPEQSQRSQEISTWLGLRRPPSPPAVKFSEVGSLVDGRITAVTLVSDIDFHTKKPKVRDDGSEVKVMRIDLDTEDGTRALFVRGSWQRGSMSLPDAIRTACAEVGRDAPHVGDVLGIRRIGDLDGVRGYRYRARLKVTE